MGPDVFCTTRDIQVLALAVDRLQVMPLIDRRLGIIAASKVLSPYLRARYGLPLAVELSYPEIDLSGLTGGASATPEGTPSEVQSVGVRFPAGGVVGATGITYQITHDAGAYGATYSAAVALPTSGQIVIDGITWTLAGTLVNGDSFSYTTRPDAGAGWATTQIAAWIMLGKDGLDPGTLQDLKYRYEAAMQWAKALLEGPAQLDQKKDATPSRAELGPLGSGQKTPWAFLKR